MAGMGKCCVFACHLDRYGTLGEDTLIPRERQDVSARQHIEQTESTPPPPALSVKANMLWNSAGSIAVLACQWLLTIVVVRISGNYEAAGVLSLGLAVYNIFAPISVYRMYVYQVSDVKRENTTGEYLTFRLITTAIALAALVGYAAITCSPASLPAVILFALYRLSARIIEVLHGADQLNGRMDYIGKSMIAQGILCFGAFCGVFALSQNLELAIGSMVAATCLIGVLYDVPRTRQFGPIKLGISAGKVKFLLISCLPIVAAAVACNAAPSAPRQILAFLTSDAALGIYTSVAAPVTIVQMGASYLYNPLLSIISADFAEGRRKKLVATLVKIAGGIALIGIICAIGFQFCGDAVLTLLFGASIEPYTYLLMPAVASTIVCAYFWFLDNVLVALRSFRGSFVSNIGALIASLVLSIPFIAQWGMNGVSFTCIAAFAVGTVLGCWYLAKLLRETSAHG